MKKVIICLFMTVAATFALSAQTPDWVIRHPVSDKEYTGVGMAPLADGDHVRKATQSALADIASQISMLVDNRSFLQQVDVDGKARELFEDKISGSVTAWLEGYELQETWSSDDTYYVYYTLDKNKYARNVEARRQRVISEGLDCLVKGREAESSMELAKAVSLYGKGLEAVEPWLFMNLATNYSGKEVNVPVELYNSFLSVFSGLAITTNTVQVTGEAFNAVDEPIAGCLSKNGTVVPNVKLKAWFASGSGVVSPAVETDYTGTAEFRITNVTSKEEVQEIRIGIDDSFWEAVPETYAALMKKNVMPTAGISLVLQSGAVSAYFHVADNELEGCDRYISSLLANNYFILTEDPDAAQCFIELSSSLDVTDAVTGGTYDLNTCLCSLRLKIYDNISSDMLLDYTVSDVKVLSPANKSYESTVAMCVREVMKRVNRELPARLGKVKVKQ